MTAFKILLMVMLGVLLVYTGFTVANDGLGLFARFFGDMAAVEWPGQFNLDFMCFLALSALWVAWRNDYSAAGLGLAAIAFVGGMVFLSVYLLVLISKADGDIRTVMLGEHAAR